MMDIPTTTLMTIICGIRARHLAICMGRDKPRCCAPLHPKMLHVVKTLSFFFTAILMAPAAMALAHNREVSKGAGNYVDQLVRSIASTGK